MPYVKSATRHKAITPEEDVLIRQFASEGIATPTIVLRLRDAGFPRTSDTIRQYLVRNGIEVNKTSQEERNRQWASVCARRQAEAKTIPLQQAQDAFAARWAEVMGTAKYTDNERAAAMSRQRTPQNVAPSYTAIATTGGVAQYGNAEMAW